MKHLAKNRPAELGAFFVIAPAIYAWLIEVGVPNVVAAITGAVLGLIPGAISWWRDGFPETGDPGDNVVTEPPPTPPKKMAAREKRGGGIHDAR